MLSIPKQIAQHIVGLGHWLQSAFFPSKRNLTFHSLFKTAIAKKVLLHYFLNELGVCRLKDFQAESTATPNHEAQVIGAI